METKLIIASAPTSNGLQSYTSAGFGTPTGALFFLSGVPAGGNTGAFCLFGLGATDGTSEFCSSIGLEAGTSTSSANCTVTDRVIAPLYDAVARGNAAFSSWVTDGVQLNWADTSVNSDWQFGVLLIKGTAVKVGTSILGVSANAQVNVTGVGFSPRAILTAAVYGSVPAPYASRDTIPGTFFSLGCMTNAGSLKQRYAGYGIRQNQGAVEQVSMAENNKILQLATEDVQYGYADIVNTGPDGFTHRTSVAASDTGFGYVCFEMDGLNVDSAAASFPTGAGNWDPASVDFTPHTVLMGMCGNPTLAAWNRDQSYNFLGLYAAEDGGGEVGVSVSTESGIPDLTPRNHNAAIYNSKLSLLNETGGEQGAFGNPSFDGSGVVFPTGNVTPSVFAHKGFILYFGSAAAPPSAAITVVDVDDRVLSNQAPWEVTGVGFSNLPGNVYINNATTKDGNEVVQPVNTWADGRIELVGPPDLSGLDVAAPLYVLVEVLS